MKDKLIVVGASIPSLLTLFTVLAYRNILQVLLSGVVYLLLANLLCFWGISQHLAAQAKIDGGPHDLSFSPHTRRGIILICAGWLVAIVALLNITALRIPQNSNISLLNYVFVTVFFLISANLVSIADSSNQVGGYIPLNFFGYSRSRKLVFLLFSLTCFILPFLIASIELAMDGAQRSIVFRHPQLCLLIVTLIAVFSAILIWTRYRKSRLLGSAGRMMLGGAALLVTVNIVTYIGYSANRYMNVLTSIVTICILITMICLWGIDSRFDQKLSISGSVES